MFLYGSYKDSECSSRSQVCGIVSMIMSVCSMLTTQQLNDDYRMPVCTYHLKRAIDGAYVRYAKVGEKVVHVWQCDKGQY
jgi:hypothetical protein